MCHIEGARLIMLRWGGRIMRRFRSHVVTAAFLGLAFLTTQIVVRDGILTAHLGQLLHLPDLPGVQAATVGGAPEGQGPPEQDEITDYPEHGHIPNRYIVVL